MGWRLGARRRGMIGGEFIRNPCSYINVGEGLVPSRMKGGHKDRPYGK